MAQGMREHELNINPFKTNCAHVVLDKLLGITPCVNMFCVSNAFGFPPTLSVTNCFELVRSCFPLL